MSKEIRVAIVEDSPGMREQWTRLLDEASGFSVDGVYSDGKTALIELPHRKPDVVLMDINMPGMSGIDCTARLHVVLPDVHILMITIYADNQRIFQALQAGASGYLLKRCSGERLLAAIREVMDGGAPMSAEIARRVIQSFQSPVKKMEEDVKLTDREMEVLGWVAKGFADKEIASQLGLSQYTVSRHLQHIYKKLHVRCRTEAATKYLTGDVDQ